ncbi:MAG: putative acylesterase/phospholipase RssA [Polaribacter sp.]
MSARRAGSAKYYLTSRGIGENSIKAFGKGEQNPRNRCIGGVTCSEEEYQLNRRTEIKITGLVLSGGGVNGIAHIGVIKALEEYGIRPSVISGASAGAIVGAFYAAGYSTDEILEFF